MACTSRQEHSISSLKSTHPNPCNPRGIHQVHQGQAFKSNKEEGSNPVSIPSKLELKRAVRWRNMTKTQRGWQANGVRTRTRTCPFESRIHHLPVSSAIHSTLLSEIRLQRHKDASWLERHRKSSPLTLCSLTEAAGGEPAACGVGGEPVACSVGVWWGMGEAHLCRNSRTPCRRVGSLWSGRFMER
eukprot:1152083-Pelagomonas_calceolata.AAC.12